jgi:hypothetical protein
MIMVLVLLAGMALGSISDHGRGSLGHFTVEVRAHYDCHHSCHASFILRPSCLDLQQTLS